MDAWQIAMVCLLPVLAAQRAFGGNWPIHKARTWLALMLAGAASYALDNQTPPVLAYVAIDLACAFAVTYRPSGAAQRMIGSLSGMMVVMHIGFAFSPGFDVAGYYWAMGAMGFAQFAILATWGVGDAGTAISRNHWFRRALGFNRDACTSTGQAVR